MHLTQPLPQAKAVRLSFGNSFLESCTLRRIWNHRLTHSCNHAFLVACRQMQMSILSRNMLPLG